MAPTRAGASSAGGPEYLMPTTARSAPSRKKIEMVALRSSTWAVPRQTFSMKGKSMASRRDDPIHMWLLLLGWQEGLGTSLWTLLVLKTGDYFFSKAVQIQ